MKRFRKPVRFLFLSCASVGVIGQSYLLYSLINFELLETKKGDYSISIFFFSSDFGKSTPIRLSKQNIIVRTTPPLMVLWFYSKLQQKRKGKESRTIFLIFSLIRWGGSEPSGSNSIHWEELIPLFFPLIKYCYQIKLVVYLSIKGGARLHSHTYSHILHNIWGRHYSLNLFNSPIAICTTCCVVIDSFRLLIIEKENEYWKTGQETHTAYTNIAVAIHTNTHMQHAAHYPITIDWNDLSVTGSQQQ